MAEPQGAVNAPATVPEALRDGPYQAVRRAWEAGCRAADPAHPPLRAALQALARTARDGAVPIGDVQALPRRTVGTEAEGGATTTRGRRSARGVLPRRSDHRPRRENGLTTE